RPCELGLSRSPEFDLVSVEVVEVQEWLPRLVLTAPKIRPAGCDDLLLRIIHISAFGKREPEMHETAAIASIQWLRRRRLMQCEQIAAARDAREDRMVTVAELLLEAQQLRVERGRHNAPEQANHRVIRLCDAMAEDSGD